jgi:hypothetical protein
MISIRSHTKVDRAGEFALCFFGLALAAASLAVCAPIAFSIATVFLFADPHNWVEARYFLSRLPARFSKFRQFFVWSFSGLALLMILYTALVCVLKAHLVADVVGGTMLATWNSLLILWVVRLVVISGAWKEGRDWGLALPFGLLLVAVAWNFPGWFGLALVYLHPFIGCWILDSELHRSRPEWRRAYHLCLLSIPLFMFMIWYCLRTSVSIPSPDLLTQQITNYAGATVISGASSYLLVATHTFLEMIHYGVWLIAIPLVSAGWKNWQPSSIPITHRSPQWKQLVPGILAASSLSVLVLWVCFALNYSVTRDVYFTLAMAHVLAEIPFLLKTRS